MWQNWSNGRWKICFTITGINYILNYMKIENRYFHNNIHKFVLYFDQMNAALLSIRDFYQPYQP